MTVLAIILATVGSAALTLSTRVLIGHRRRSAPQQVEQQILCEAPSPDDKLTCELELGHWGWHQASGSEWFGAAWDVDEYGDTQAAPTQAAPEPSEPVAATSGTGKPYTVGPMGNRRPNPEWYDWGQNCQPRFRPYPPKPPTPPTRLAAAPKETTAGVGSRAAVWGSLGGVAALILTVIAFVGSTDGSRFSQSQPSTTVATVTAFTTTVVTTTVTPTATPTTASRTYQPTYATTSLAPSVYSPTNTPQVQVGNDEAFLAAIRQTGSVGDGDADDTLIDMAHGTCRSMDDNIAMDTRIENNPGLGFVEAKAEEAGSYRAYGWRDPETLIDLAMQYYCPTLIVTTAANLTPADATFANGWIALKGNILGPLVGVMKPRALAVCRQLQTEPEWQVVDDVDATDHGNNKSWKQEFVDLAMKAYCPAG